MMQILVFCVSQHAGLPIPIHDLFYSKTTTSFQDWASSNGAHKSYDGLGMLIEQAALSFDIWNDFKPNTIGLEKTLGLR